MAGLAVAESRARCVSIRRGVRLDGADAAQGAVMHIDVGGDGRDVAGDAARLRRLRQICGMAIVFLGGPAAMAFAHVALGMGPIESAAVLILLSGWLGPRVMRVGDA